MESIIKCIVIYAVFLIQIVLGTPSWSLSSNPNTFGKNFDLTCSFSAKGSKHNSQSKGNGSTDIHSLNGEPVDNINQLEKQHTVHRMYTLTTSAYNKDGVKVQYDCLHGNNRYEHVLNMTIESFEYIANTNNVPQLINNVNKEDLFSMTFRNFTEIPQCSVMYGPADHSKELKSTLDSPGQAYRIYLPETAIKSKCPKVLTVTCDIGEGKIVNTLRPVNDNCLPHTAKHSGQGLQGQEKDQTIGHFGLGIFIVVSIVFVGGFILGIMIKECNKCRGLR